MPHLELRLTQLPQGFKTTKQVEGVLGNMGASRMESVLKNIPLGILGTVDDIGYAAVFLASEEAKYITGATIDVNGGFCMR